MEANYFSFKMPSSCGKSSQRLHFAMLCWFIVFFCGKCVFVYYKFMYSLVAEDLAFTDKLTGSQFAVLNVAMTEK